MSVFLDSSVLIEVIKGNIELERPRYFINPIVYAEVLYGLLTVKKSEKQFQMFLNEEGIEVMPLGLETASIYTKLKYTLDKKGKPLADNDLLIAASCLEHSLTIHTLNLKHFERIPKLKVFKG